MAADVCVLREPNGAEQKGGTVGEGGQNRQLGGSEAPVEGAAVSSSEGESVKAIVRELDRIDCMAFRHTVVYQVLPYTKSVVDGELHELGFLLT